MTVKFYKLLFVFSIVVLFIATGCNDNSCNPLLNFKGITVRDEAGKLGKEDATDWIFKDIWGEHEVALFSSTHSTDCFPPSGFSIMAYPNPTEGAFQLKFKKSDHTTVEIRLVDFDCRTLIYVDDIKNNSIALEPTNFDKAGTVRLYYKFIEDGCEYRGHGDIEIF